MNEKKILSYIGISRKAGFCTVGTELTCIAVRTHKVKVAVLASDASDNTKKRVTDCCASHKTELITAFSCDILGNITGKNSPVSSCGITDEGLAKAIIQNYNK